MAGMDLGKMVGPLPLGAWLAVGGTGLGVALWARGTGSGMVGDAEPVAGVDEWSSTGTGVNGQWVDVTPPDTSSATVTDNDEWGRRAVTWLIAEGYDAGLSASAIGKALQERRLSVREYALWWLALREFGPPPYAVIVKVPAGFTPPNNTPATPAPQHTPPSARVYVTKKGDTLRRIARKSYNDEAKWHRIYEANRRGVKRPFMGPGWLTSPRQDIPAGRLLYIPKG